MKNYWEIFFKKSFSHLLIFSLGPRTILYYRWRVALIHVGLPFCITLNHLKWKLLQYSLHFVRFEKRWERNMENGQRVLVNLGVRFKSSLAVQATYIHIYKSGSWERLTFYPLTTASVLKLSINIQLLYVSGNYIAKVNLFASFLRLLIIHLIHRKFTRKFVLVTCRFI